MSTERNALTFFLCHAVVFNHPTIYLLQGFFFILQKKKSNRIFSAATNLTNQKQEKSYKKDDWQGH